MNKTFKINPLKMSMYDNGYVKGFNLKRELTYSECHHIVYNLLGIAHTTKEDTYDNEEWQEFKQQFTRNVNGWLKGNYDDNVIIDYAYDCTDEPLGMFNLIPIIYYLQKKEIV